MSRSNQTVLHLVKLGRMDETWQKRDLRSFSVWVVLCSRVPIGRSCVCVCVCVSWCSCLLPWHCASILWATRSCDHVEVKPRTNRGCFCLCVYWLFCWFPGSGGVAGVLGAGEEQLPHGAEPGEWSHIHAHAHFSSHYTSKDCYCNAGNSQITAKTFINLNCREQ